VEDDMLLSLVQGRIITRLGYEVVAKVVTGEDAIQKIKVLDPDVVIMDINLKGEIDGIEAMSRVRSFSDVPVIFLSGNSDKQTVEQAKKTGHAHFLLKPVSTGDLREPLRRAVNRKRSKTLTHAS
jgi:CheY-like chemotaxis protein